ncbi:MAG: nicotinate-nucleotide--dimethylbenzimidazole phosphoribosyltransferase, partial [Proteobacteria bacterium]|nr:nicotinate-nucleotide--dimethylbenzimidazole phosphoribosyltransferase [Pseudomonadota bacterium]
GNHGVTAQGVSAFPPEVTAQMVGNFQAGGAAINQLCTLQGFDLKVLDAGVETPTKDFSVEPAMSEDEFVEAFTLGYDAVDKSWQVLCLGEMGIGNTTSAAAICLGLFDGDAADWTGPGTGVTGSALAHKARIVAEAVAKHRPDITDGLDVLRCVGGKELVAIAGAVLAAREARILVILDGYTCTAAAAALRSVKMGALNHCVIGHQSAEPGHQLLLQQLGEEPLLSLNMRLGEGTGAALAVGVLRGALACHNGMATFEDAGVSNKD